MEISSLVLPLVVGLVLGAGGAWLALGARLRGREAELTSQLAQASVALAEERQATAESQREAAEWQARYSAEQARTELLSSARLEAERRLADVVDSRRELSEQFALISQRSLEDQGKKVDAAAQARLEQTEQWLKPMQESLAKLEQKLAEVERERVASAVDLRNQVQTVARTGEQLRAETQSLVMALRKPQVRGAWGETQLKRVVELAGMLEHCDFETQSSGVATTGESRRPDLTVHMTGGRQLYVDAKVPLAAFLELGDDEGGLERARTAFSGHLRKHMDQLGAKHYWDLDGRSAPELVVLFLPGDGLMAHALAAMPDLYEQAARRNVVIATPSILIALLRTVEYGWRQVAMLEGAHEVRDAGVEMYKRLRLFADKFAAVGVRMDASAKAYNEAVASFQGRVMPQARRFEGLKVATGETIHDVAMAELPATRLVIAEMANTEQELPEARHLRYGGDGSGANDMAQPEPSESLRTSA